jgi:hypothetical protein
MWGFMRKNTTRRTGEYNAGQKLMFWSMVPIIAVLFSPALPSGSRGLPVLLGRHAPDGGRLHAVCAFTCSWGSAHWYAAYWTRIRP